jgi:hypothetical protein
MADPVPLAGPVAAAGDRAVGLLGRARLRAHDVHRRFGEILDSAGMVEVEMGEHDVANVARREAEALDLKQRRLLLLQRQAHHGKEKAAECR